MAEQTADFTEYEGKILDIDPNHISDAIAKAGGTLIGDYMFQRYVFDTVPARPDTWVRLRTNGTESTLTVKEIRDDSIEGTSEWEVAVSDFDTTLTILQKSGLKPKGYQENRRTEFSLGRAMLTIDYWPQLKPYLEIEAQDRPTVERIAEQLGFDALLLVGDNTMKLYARQGIDLNAVAELRFAPTADTGDQTVAPSQSSR